jgi:ferredoxin-thioredoxin reductase catalytic chain
MTALRCLCQSPCGKCAVSMEDGKNAALERVTRMARRHAEKSGFALQSDRAQLAYVLKGLARNLMEHGKPYCPCREVRRDAPPENLSICPCRTHREEILQFGECECGLFTKRLDSHTEEKE